MISSGDARKADGAIFFAFPTFHFPTRPSLLPPLRPDQLRQPPLHHRQSPPRSSQRQSHQQFLASDRKQRLNPRNGLCLVRTQDAAFDRHLITLHEDYRLVVSRDIRDFGTRQTIRENESSRQGAKRPRGCSRRMVSPSLRVKLRRTGCGDAEDAEKRMKAECGRKNFPFVLFVSFVVNQMPEQAGLGR